MHNSQCTIKVDFLTSGKEIVELILLKILDNRREASAIAN